MFQIRRKTLSSLDYQPIRTITLKTLSALSQSRSFIRVRVLLRGPFLATNTSLQSLLIPMKLVLFLRTRLKNYSALKWIILLNSSRGVQLTWKLQSWLLGEKNSSSLPVTYNLYCSDKMRCSLSKPAPRLNISSCRVWAKRTSGLSERQIDFQPVNDTLKCPSSVYFSMGLSSRLQFFSSESMMTVVSASEFPKMPLRETLVLSMGSSSSLATTCSYNFSLLLFYLAIRMRQASSRSLLTFSNSAFSLYFSLSSRNISSFFRTSSFNLKNLFAKFFRSDLASIFLKILALWAQMVRFLAILYLLYLRWILIAFSFLTLQKL